jgi:PAS domain S-box-containing protein
MGMEQRSDAGSVAGVKHATLLGSVVESATECSLVATDFSGLVLTWSEGARGLYGYSPSEIVGQPAARLYRREDVAAGLLVVMMARAAQTGMWEGQVQRVHKDGSVSAARVVVTPRRGEGGETIGFLMIGFLVAAGDLSRPSASRPEGLAGAPLHAVRDRGAPSDRELREAEIETLTAEQGLLHEELRVSQGQAAESSMLVETLLLTSPIGFGFVDRDLRIRRMNEPLAALSGVP